MYVEIPAHGRADFADQQIGGAEVRIVSRTPEEAELARQRGEVAEERAARADLAAVEARVADALDLDVDGLLGDARGIAQHVDAEVVAADLAKALLVVARVLVAPDRALAELPRRK